MEYKKALEEVLINLRCIDVTENKQVESYVDDSIRVIKEALDENKDTTQEVPLKKLYEGRCSHCDKHNEYKVPIGKQLPKGVIPRYCHYCGKEMEYSKVEE